MAERVCCSYQNVLSIQNRVCCLYRVSTTKQVDHDDQNQADSRAHSHTGQIWYMFPRKMQGLLYFRPQYLTGKYCLNPYNTDNCLWK